MEEIEQLQPVESRPHSVLNKQERRQIEIEESLETISYYLDDLIPIPGVGWRFGLDSLIGLVPNVGDITTSVLSFYILVAGVRYGVPKITLVRMAFNIGLDYLVGVIPFVGDAFDFFWKSNQQNMNLIRTRGKGLGKGTAGDWLFVIVIILLLIGLLVGSVLLSLFILGIFFKGIYDLLNSLV
jgi:hypothetical protein